MTLSEMPRGQSLNSRPLTNLALPEIIRLWRVDLDAPLDVEGLSRDEVDRASRFRFPIHRQRFLAASAALRQILGQQLQCPPGEIEFTYSPAGKPSLPCSSTQFNVARTENVALIALAPFPIGVDIELMRPVEFEMLAGNVCSPAELRAWSKLKPEGKSRAFHTLWTRKEALLKGTGCGITEHLQNVSVFFGNAAPLEIPANVSEDSWEIYSFEISPHHAAAVAWMAT
jgi:4'-phosphopantetheinyl transferase